MATKNQIDGNLKGETGTGKYVGDTSPTLVTPEIGAATGTSLNLGSSTTMTGMINDDTFATASTSTAASSSSIKNYVDNHPSNYKNSIIIGGNFDTNPWQRGTSFPAAVAGSYHADRWRTSNTTTAVITMEKVADAPTEAQAGYYSENSLGMTVTTAFASPTATGLLYHVQLVEGYNALPVIQKDSVLSFWVKATVTGIYCVVCHNHGADRSFIAEYTVNASNTWEYKEIPITASPAAGTWNYTTGTGITCQFSQVGASTFYGSTGWNVGAVYTTSNQVNNLATVGNIFRLALVQWTPGTVAQPFIGRSEQEELKLCQRYFFKTFPQGTAPATGAGTSGAEAYRCNIAGASQNQGSFLRYPQDMRASPTLTTYNPVSANSNWYNSSLPADSASFNAASAASNGVFCNNIQVAADAPTHFISIHLTAESEL